MAEPQRRANQRSAATIRQESFEIGSATPALQLVGLQKRFGANIAVDHLDLTVPHGAFFGLVGPNGAGKTTTMAMAVGLLRPDGGTARIFGHDLWHEPEVTKGQIGVLPDDLSVPERLTGRELLTYTGLLRGMDAATVAQRAAELLLVMDLLGAERTLVLDYSTGMRKKIGLALALLHDPRLLVLDEPFEAVDPVSASILKAILKQFVAAGGTVIFSSHVMALVEQLCDHVAVVAKGRTLAAGSLDQVRGGRSLEETFVDLVAGRESVGRGLSWLAS
jgi:ABC-2 type transport system ATP-binding protein